MEIEVDTAQKNALGKLLPKNLPARKRKHLIRMMLLLR
jgi:hypothetical protein